MLDVIYYPVSAILWCWHKAFGAILSEQAALKCLYLVTRSLDPTGRGRKRWKPALNAFAITFEGRITPTGN
jgi:transposase-like protein